MTIKLEVEPRREYSWEEFKAEKEPFAIALDGLVVGPTMREPIGPYANFDHHKNVDRFATRSTSDQVHLEINMGLFETFSKDGKPNASVFVNDPDEDTCLSWWLLQNHEQIKGKRDPKVDELLHCEDRLDTTAGAYDFGNTKTVRQLAWVFEPYQKARFEGRIQNMGASEMRTVMEAVDSRISKYVAGDGDELGMEGQYERIGGGNGWSMVRENGPLARAAMYADGITAFVSVLSEHEDGSRKLTFGKKSPWVAGVDLSKVYAACNDLERKLQPQRPKNQVFGGTDTIGGSPREGGTYLTLDQISDVMNGV